MGNVGQINEIISKTIEDSVREALKNCPFDKTFVGVVVQIVNSNTYIIRYDDANRTFTTKHNLGLCVGDIVHITYPQNNINKKYMIEDICK